MSVQSNVHTIPWLWFLYYFSTQSSENILKLQNAGNIFRALCKASVKTNLDICNINKKQLSLEHLQQPKLPEDDRLPPAHKMAGIGDPKL